MQAQFAFLQVLHNLVGLIYLADTYSSLQERAICFGLFTFQAPLRRKDTRKPQFRPKGETLFAIANC